MRCLALNASFEPLTMVPVRRALRLVIEGKAEIVESDAGESVRSERLTLPKPAIIRLVKFVHVPRRFRRQVTNTFLFARDGYRCQYCHRGQADLRHRECLTRDHLVPLSRGGDNDWTNVVTACSSCNTKKGTICPRSAECIRCSRRASRTSCISPGRSVAYRPRRPSTFAFFMVKKPFARSGALSRPDLERLAPCFQPQRRQARKTKQQASGSAAQYVSHLVLPPGIVRIAFQEPSQLVQI